MKRLQVIESWVTEAEKGSSSSEYVDLHIDRIDERWRQKTQWVDGGFEALDLAVNVRNRLELSHSVALVFGLNPNARVSGSEVQTVNRLESHFGWTPPSLYLLYPEQEFWVSHKSDSFSAEEIKTPAFCMRPYPIQCLLSLYRKTDLSETITSFIVSATAQRAGIERL